MNVPPSKSVATILMAIGVFVIAVLIRLPSCYESFWVDELHTAWAIGGDFGQVAQRAAWGNQTPVYFQAMWVWKSMVGGSEIGLRLSSVLAVATASMLLVVGVSRSTGRVSAGVLAGSVLAVDNNSIFFGTEFRPYAWVILLSVIATWAATSLMREKNESNRARLRFVLVAAIGLATLLHPTAIVTLGLLAMFTAAHGVMQGAAQGVVQGVMELVAGKARFRSSIMDAFSLMLVVAVGFALANSSLSHSWAIRNQWAAFGQATSWVQFRTMWPWWTFAITPAVIGLLWLTKPTGDEAWRKEVGRAMMPMCVATLATMIFFAASYFQWVPLWHRRYFVAALPMFAWSMGCCFALPMSRQSDRLAEAVVFVAGIVVVGDLMWQQGTIDLWKQGRTQLVVRGEDWRGAVDWLQSQRQSGESVSIDADLIESTHRYQHGRYVRPNDYYRFPLLGPYAIADCVDPAIPAKIENAEPVELNLRTQNDQASRWLVSRSHHRRIMRWLQSQWAKPVVWRSFGGVHVVRYKWLDD